MRGWDGKVIGIKVSKEKLAKRDERRRWYRCNSGKTKKSATKSCAKLKLLFVEFHIKTLYDTNYYKYVGGKDDFRRKNNTP